MPDERQGVAGGLRNGQDVRDETLPSVGVDRLGLSEHSADAVLIADVNGRVQLANEPAGTLFDLAPEELIGRSVETLVPQQFRHAHRSGFKRLMTTGEARVAGGPIRVMAKRADGTELPVALTLSELRGSDPGPVSVVATFRVLPDRALLESQALLSKVLGATVDASYDGVLAATLDRRVLAVNNRFCELWNLAPSSLKIGQQYPDVEEIVLRQLADPAALEVAIQWGRIHPREPQLLDLLLRDGRLLEAHGAPILDDEDYCHGRVWYIHDATEQRAARARLLDVERAQRFLLDAASAVARSSGFVNTLRALGRVAVPVLGDLCLIDIATERGEIVRVAAEHADPDMQPLTDALGSFPPDPAGEHPSARAIREGVSLFSGEIGEAFLRATTLDETHLDILRKLNFESYMTVPLVVDGASTGGLTVVSAGSGRHFGPADIALAEDLALRMATTVEKERSYEVQRSQAHNLQSSLLPNEPPQLAGIEVAVRYLPGTVGVEVGGDFWDITSAADGALVLAIGDVVGHDMTAAATMAQLRSAARALRPSSADPDVLIARLQAAWDQLGLERMATALFARLDPRTSSLSLASAGHPPPLMVDKGVASYLPVEPAPLLGGPSRRPIAYQTRWPAGALLVLYSDGLVEDRAVSIETGLARLAEVTAAAPSMEPEAVADYIIDELVPEHRGDDIALVVIRRQRTEESTQQGADGHLHPPP